MNTDIFAPGTITKVRTMLEKADLYRAPVDLKKLAREVFNIRLAYADFSALSNKMRCHVNGIIHRNAAGCTIFSHEGNTDAQTRENLARILSRYSMIHRNDHRDVIICTKENMDREEAKFATELLMPAELVRRAHEQQFIPETTDLARIFQVTPARMKERLDRLGLPYV